MFRVLPHRVLLCSMCPNMDLLALVLERSLPTTPPSSDASSSSSAAGNYSNQKKKFQSAAILAVHRMSFHMLFSVPCGIAPAAPTAIAWRPDGLLMLHKQTHTLSFALSIDPNQERRKKN